MMRRDLPLVLVLAVRMATGAKIPGTGRHRRLAADGRVVIFATDPCGRRNVYSGDVLNARPRGVPAAGPGPVGIS